MKLSINDFKAMEIIELSDRLEMASTLDTNTIKEDYKTFTLKKLMNEAFGICWFDNEILKVFFDEYVVKCFDIVPSTTKGYVSAIEC